MPQMLPAGDGCAHLVEQPAPELSITHKPAAKNDSHLTAKIIRY